jgi:O-Antigen ligase
MTGIEQPIPIQHSARPHLAAGAGPVTHHDRYGFLLCCGLVGYATFGKGFAYIGVPSLFVGEILLLMGVVVIIRSGCEIAMLASLPGILLLVLIVWVIVRTVPYVRTYGVNAARDSVVVVYGLFAFVVIALLLERPDRLTWVVAAYSRFAWFYAFAGIQLVNANFVLGPLMPSWPGLGAIPFFYVRLGECASHLAGAAVFMLLGLRRVGAIWGMVMLISIGMITISRGAMLACAVPIALAAPLTRQKKRLGSALVLTAILFGVISAADLQMPLGNGRSVGPDQIISGFESIIGRSEVGNLDGTKLWRLKWWDAIVGYTIDGPYFWTGKGFGVNLAEDDGFMVGQEFGGPPLRSPHSAHMTVLARAGVPGLVLWVATGVAWVGTLLWTMIIARSRGDLQWANLFLWIACYGVAIVVDSSFDVALEGPMLGIWFWCLFGLGIASTLIYRARINTPFRVQTTDMSTAEI